MSDNDDKMELGKMGEGQEPPGKKKNHFMHSCTQYGVFLFLLSYFIFYLYLYIFIPCFISYIIIVFFFFFILSLFYLM